MFNSFYTKVSEIINFHAPIKQLSKCELKMNSKPWITTAVRHSIDVKNNIYKKYLKTKSTYYTIFKLYRNKLNQLPKLSKNKYRYYTNYFQANISNSKKV